MARREVIRVALVVATLAACKGGKSPAQCKTEVDDLVAFVAAIPQPARVPPETHLVERRELPLAPMPAVDIVIVEPDGIAYHGSHVADAEELATRLQAPGERAIAIAIDGDAAWGIAVDVMVAVAASGHDHQLVMFSRPYTMPPPPPPRTRVEEALALAGAPGTKKYAAELSRQYREILRGCRNLDRAFSEMSDTADPDKWKILVDGIGRALPECDCAVDIAQLRSLLWAIGYAPEPAAAFEVVIARDGTRFEYPLMAGWSEVAPHLSPGAKIWPSASF